VKERFAHDSSFEKKIQKIEKILTLEKRIGIIKSINSKGAIGAGPNAPFLFTKNRHVGGGKKH